MRVVIDANVLLSVALRPSTDPLLEALLARRFLPVTSEALMDELRGVLARPQCIRMLGVQRCRMLLAVIREAALIVTPAQRLAICRDPTDDQVLEAAVEGHVEYIVTGDHDQP